MINFCTQCGNPVKQGSFFCTNCGTRLIEPKKTYYRSSLINPDLPIVTEYDDRFDKAMVFELFEAVGQGDCAAIYELATRYRLGVDGVKKDLVRAIELYKEVLKYQNNRSAFYYIRVFVG